MWSYGENVSPKFLSTVGCPDTFYLLGHACIVQTVLRRHAIFYLNRVIFVTRVEIACPGGNDITLKLLLY